MLKNLGKIPEKLYFRSVLKMGVLHSDYTLILTGPTLGKPTHLLH